MERSLSFFDRATSDAASSGKEVPSATIVSPINTSLNPKNLAMKMEDLTTK